MLLNKNRIVEVLKREQVGLGELAYEMSVPRGIAARMAGGVMPLGYAEAKGLMRLIGFWNFAYAAESEEVRVHAKRIASEAPA